MYTGEFIHLHLYYIIHLYSFQALEAEGQNPDEFVFDVSDGTPAKKLEGAVTGRSINTSVKLSSVCNI